MNDFSAENHLSINTKRIYYYNNINNKITKNHSIFLFNMLSYVDKLLRYNYDEEKPNYTSFHHER